MSQRHAPNYIVLTPRTYAQAADFAARHQLDLQQVIASAVTLLCAAMENLSCAQIQQLPAKINHQSRSSSDSPQPISAVFDTMRGSGGVQRLVSSARYSCGRTTTPRG